MFCPPKLFNKYLFGTNMNALYKTENIFLYARVLFIKYLLLKVYFCLNVVIVL